MHKGLETKTKVGCYKSTCQGRSNTNYDFRSCFIKSLSRSVLNILKSSPILVKGKHGKPQRKCIDYFDPSKTTLPHDTTRRKMTPSPGELILKERKGQLRMTK